MPRKAQRHPDAKRQRPRKARTRARKRIRAAKVHANPALAILGNPPQILSRDAHAMTYTHAEDGKDYKHDFERGKVTVYCLTDGSVMLRRRDGKPIWGDF